MKPWILGLVIAAAAGSVVVVALASGSDSEPSAPSAKERAYLADLDAFERDVDLSAIPNRDLLAAGHDVCDGLAQAHEKTGERASGHDLDRMAYIVLDKYELDRASLQPGFQGVGTVGGRVAFRVATSAPRFLCPNVPFSSAR